jgi:uncharacterized protein
MGLGVAEDYADAMRWYRKAADAGHAGAMYDIGTLHEDGLGMPANRDLAVDWYRKAAAAGSSWAKAKLQRLGVK